MKKELLKYAELIVKAGLNVKKDQTVVINAPVQSYEFVALVSEAAYDVGAKEVVVKYNDSTLSKLKYTHSPMCVFENIPKWMVDFNNDYAKDGACFLSLVGDDPASMKGVETSKVAAFSKNFTSLVQPYRDLLDNGTCAWCIVGVSTIPWAKAVFPNIDEAKAVELLWDSIFKATHVYSENPVETWNEHRQSFENRVNFLNELNIESFTIRNNKGTNLTVGLLDDYLFAGGGSYLKDGSYNFPNMPTEEIFTSPHRLKTNGKVTSSLPLNYQGNLIENFYFEFKDGKVIDYGAKTGQSVLKDLIEYDDNSCYLGEVALVPFDSPISNMNTIFYNTLFDENAVCHLALGRGFNECIKDGLSFTKEQLHEKGLNDSLLHVDFMFGTSDLSVVATTRQGKDIDIFIDGNFVI